MCEKNFKIAFYFFVGISTVFLLLTFYFNLNNENILYTRNYVYWEIEQLNNDMLNEIYQSIVEGTVVVQEQHQLFVYDPDLYIQDLLVVEGRMFTLEESQQSHSNHKLVTIPTDGNISNLVNEYVTGIFSELNSNNQSINEILPLNHYISDKPVRVYYVNGSQIAKLNKIFKATERNLRQELKLSWPKFELRPFLNRILLIIMIVFQILFYGILSVIHMTYRDELAQYRIYSKIPSIYLLTKKQAKSLLLDHLLCALILGLFLIKSTNLNYSINGLLIIFSVFWLLMIMSNYFTLRKVI